MGKKKSSKTPQALSAENPQTRPSESATSRFPLSLTILVLATVGVNGASVMVLELLGTRVLAPVFGMSLYIWTALIAVTLLSLAVGYPIGGAVADRFPRRHYILFITVLAVSAWLLLLALFKNTVLEAFSNMGPRSGPVVVSLILFTVPLALLAMTPPMAVRYMAGELGRIGVTVGKVSAISTIGSLIGTLTTGFYLIPEVGVGKTLWYLAIVLFILGIAGCITARADLRTIGIFTAVTGMVASIGYPSYSPPKLPYPKKFIAARSSAYGEIRIIETKFFSKAPGSPLWDLRFMFIGHGQHTVQFRDHDYGLPVFVPLAHRFPLYWDALRCHLLFRDKPRKCLLIGLGGGVMYEFVKRWEVNDIEVVEIDPVVVEMARDYFDCQVPKDKLFIEDARRYIRRCQRKYDLIIMDAFGAGTAPSHLFTREAMQDLRSLLTEEGVLFSNYIAAIEGEMSGCLTSLASTVKEVFPYTVIVAPTLERNNYIFFSSLKPLEISPKRLAAISDEDRYFLGLLVKNHALLLQKEAPSELTSQTIPQYLNLSHLVPQGEILTDEHNSLEVLNIVQNEHLRRVMLDNFKEIFLSGYN